MALDATIRAAAPHQRARRERAAAAGELRGRLAVLIEPSDWRRNVRVARSGALVVFLVDGSGSMGARGRMAAGKGAVLSLLTDSYVNRDQVALISFRDAAAEVVVAPTNSVDLAERCLRGLTSGGRTPLAAGLVAAGRLVGQSLRRRPDLRPLVVVITDGRGNVALDGHVSRSATEQARQVAQELGADERVTWIVVDADPARRGAAARRRAPSDCAVLAEALGARHITVAELRADALASVVAAALPVDSETRPRPRPFTVA